MGAVAGTHSVVSAHREDVTEHAFSYTGIPVSAGPIDLSGSHEQTGTTAGSFRLTGGGQRGSSCCRQVCLLSREQASLGRRLCQQSAEQGTLGPREERCEGLAARVWVGSALLT